MPSLKYLFAKAMKYIRIPAVRDSSISEKARVCPGCNLIEVELGDYSYIGNDCTVAQASIGKFCSIGSNCSIGGGVHDMTHASTSPVFHRGRNALGVSFSNLDEPVIKRVRVGNDVWIGDTVFIRDGISVGDGAVVGAHAVLTKDVPPYAIVAGCPARVLRYRFDESTIKRLVDSRWWDFDEQTLRSIGKHFESPIQLLDALEHMQGT